jgi:predicted PurR-regulated permease PerM
MFFAIATVFLLFAILIFAKRIFIPLGMALLISLILYPLTKRFEMWGVNRMVAAFMSILIAFLIMGGGIFFFFTQIVNLPRELSEFQNKIMSLFSDVLMYINNHTNFNTDLEVETVLNQAKEWLKTSALPLVESTFYSTTSFLTGMVATIIYTYLILIYRIGLTQAFVKFSPEKDRPKVLELLKRVQLVGQKYLSGMFLLIIILGLANSIGLWIIGIDSPFLFGFMAAVMSIIPYVGTTLGASIPVLYAFMSHDSLWVPFAVAVLFWFIQLIESNFLSPKVVGSSLELNALAAILSLIIGASVWGIAGMILFLPYMAMLKVFCVEYDSLKPIALLIGSQIYNGTEEDEEFKTMPQWILKKKSWFAKSSKKSKKSKSK